MKNIYLDNNASTPVRPEVFDAMVPFLKGEFANASSIYQLGQRARKAVEDARANIAALVGADDPNEIIFTSGGTESNNTAVKGVVAAYKSKGKRVVTSAIEHSAIRNVIKELEQLEMADNVVIPVQPNGIVNVDAVDEAITPDTALVTIMAANNEIGTIQPIAAISDICKKKNVIFHTDAVQMAGKMEIRVYDLGVDLLSLSGHKFGAPKGIGILYIRKGTRMYSLLQGGRQEKNRRAGTENVPGIIGMGVAAQLAQKNLTEDKKRYAQLRDLLESLLFKDIPSLTLNGDKNDRVANTTNICFDYTDSSAMIMALDLKGVQCSNGSACIAGSPDPSHVLLAMGLSQDKAHGALRFSVGHETTEDDIRIAAAIIAETTARVRQNHPLWKKAAGK
jgi:cysteine desulfurase